MEYLSGSIEGVSVVHEVDGTLDLKYIDAPARDEAQRLVRLALDSWQAEARIAKNTPRAGAVCRYCRVKARCDARDLETGATTDWPSDYKVG